MFNDVEDEKALRELNILFSKLKGVSVVTPTDKQFNEAKEELMIRLSGEGNLNRDYVCRIFMAHNYARTCRYKGTGHTLLEDINKRKVYNIQDYTKVKPKKKK
ncbi:hypothetical protein [Clostridium sp.]|uniref:hypothetical protein n=1 Tax=Clostridium sp. TaxID=1506 RepID=UPI002FC6C958